MNLPSKLTIGSCLVYPKGSSKASADARSLVWNVIKQDGMMHVGGKSENFIARSARHFHENLSRYPRVEEHLAHAGTLVPVPRSAPIVKGGLWVPRRIAEELVKNGIGDGVEAFLERTVRAAPSSGVKKAEDRPDPPEHFRTMRCTGSLMRIKRITLVDDVVTRGSTLIASTGRLMEAFPDAEIRAFALVSVESDRNLQHFHEVFEPRIGTISYDADANRLNRKSNCA